MSGLGPLRLVVKGSTGLHSVEAGAKRAAELEAAPGKISWRRKRSDSRDWENCPAVHFLDLLKPLL